MIFCLASFPVCSSVSISHSSSMVPKPPGKTISALAICANHSLRIKKYLKLKLSSGLIYGFANCSCGSSIERPTDLPPASYAPRFAASMMPGPPPEQTTKRRGRGPSVSDQVVSLCDSCRAMFLQLLGGHSRCLLLFQSRVSSLRRLVRFDPVRTEHHDGVPDPLSLELHQRVDVLPQAADWPRRRALQKLWIFMRRFRRVLRLQFLAVGHESSPPLRRTLIVGIAAAPGNVFR